MNIKALRIPLAALATGLLLNFMVYRGADSYPPDAFSAWRDVAVVTDELLDTKPAMAGFLGVASSDMKPLQTDSDLAVAGESYGFQLDGQDYRLSGLVVGSRASATLINDDGSVMRLEPGELLSGGHRVVTIDLDEITLAKTDGSIETVKIYKW